MQLDLMTSSPPRCRVVAFPLAKRVSKVRRVADLLERKHGRDAEIYWKTTVRGLIDQLARAGIAGAEATEEVRSFHEAVQSELTRRAYRGSRPGGSAA